MQKIFIDIKQCTLKIGYNLLISYRPGWAPLQTPMLKSKDHLQRSLNLYLLSICSLFINIITYISNIIPNLSNMIPYLSNIIPYLSNIIPYLSNTIPYISNIILYLSNHSLFI